MVAFEFQEVPLEEAVNLVAAGGGIYAGIKAHLLLTLPKLESGKAYVFGLPNGKELEEKERRALCVACSAALSKADILWKVTYSSVKKVFVCVPSEKSMPKKVAQESSQVRSMSQEDRRKKVGRILELRQAGMSSAEIATELGMRNAGAVDGFQYQYKKLLEKK